MAAAETPAAVEPHLTPRRTEVMHAWVMADVKQIYVDRAAEVGMHVDEFVARILTAGAQDYARQRLKREK